VADLTLAAFVRQRAGKGGRSPHLAHPDIGHNGPFKQRLITRIA
jgi:hypothetical protein